MTGGREATTGRIRAVLFDLDGTLVDSMPGIAEAMSAAAAEHGHTVSPEALLPLIGPPMDVFVRNLFDVTEAQAAAIDRSYLRLYHQHYLPATPPHEGADRLLAALHDAGVLLAVVSNKRDEDARTMVELQGWDDRFRLVHGREAGAAKPDPEAALTPLRMLGITAAEAAFVGDTEFDMNCARDAGLAVVVGLCGVRTAEELRTEGATHVVGHLDEVVPLLLGAGVAP